MLLHGEKYKMNSKIPKTDSVKVGTKRFQVFGPKIWNFLPHHIK